MESQTESLLPFIGLGIVSALCVAVLIMGLKATADQDPSTDQIPRILPYNGVLEFNGQAVNAEDQWLKFEVESVEPATGAHTVVFSQSLQVDIYGGRFTAALGPVDDSGRSLDNVFVVADELYIKTTVLGEHNPEDPASTADDDIVLGNPRQPERLHMSPFAVWASHATDFRVWDTLQTRRIETSTAEFSRADSPEGQTLRLQPNGGSVRIGDADPTQGGDALFNAPGSGIRFSRIGFLTIDSEIDSLININANIIPTQGVHIPFNNNKGASRIQMDAGELSFEVARSGEFPVEWATGITIADDETTVLNGLTVYEHGLQRLKVGSATDDHQSAFGGGMSADTLSATGTSFAGTSNSTQLAVLNNATLNGNVEISSTSTFTNTSSFNNTIFNDYLDTSIITFGNTGPNLQIYVKNCNGGSCDCNSADDMAVSGGTLVNSDGGIQDSRPIYNAATRIWGWRSTCVHTEGNPGDEGESLGCDRTYVTCAKLNSRDIHGNLIDNITRTNL